MNTTDKRRKYLERLERLKSDRSSWEPQWQEISDFILPRRGRIKNDPRANHGGKKGQKIVDATGTRSMRALAAGLQSGLTSPSRPWFRLGLEDDGLARAAKVRTWLHAVEKIMFNALAKSGFYQAVHGLYLELAAFGTGVLYCAEGSRAPLHFRCLTAGEYHLATDHEGMVDSIYRVFTLSARAMEQRFGSKNLSEGVRKSLENNRDEHFEILHAVQPRGEFDTIRRDTANMPFESVFMELKGDHRQVLLETGYMEQPHMCPRWDTTGSEIYGRSPGMDVLPDVMMLQEMSKSQVMAIHKVLNPPMRVPAMYSKRLNLLPGAQNQVEQNQSDAVAPLYQINPDIRAVSAKIDDTRQAIRQGLYNDLFMMLSEDKRSNVTAAEVMEKHEEKLLQLGPVVERQQSELLDPLLNRVFGVLLRAGAFPSPPKKLEGADFKIEYISLLAQAQRMAGISAINNAATFIKQAAAMDPAIIEKFNVDLAVEEHARMVGLPPNLLFSREEMETRRKAKLEEAMLTQQAGLGDAPRPGPGMPGSGLPTPGLPTPPAMPGTAAPMPGMPGFGAGLGGGSGAGMADGGLPAMLQGLASMLGPALNSLMSGGMAGAATGGAAPGTQTHGMGGAAGVAALAPMLGNLLSGKGNMDEQLNAMLSPQKRKTAQGISDVVSEVLKRAGLDMRGLIQLMADKGMGLPPERLAHVGGLGEAIGRMLLGEASGLPGKPAAQMPGPKSASQPLSQTKEAS